MRTGLENDRSKQDSLPEITLRIPGPWESFDQLRESLAKTKTGYTIADPESDDSLQLIHQKSGGRFRLSVDVADDELAELFAGSVRMPADELKALKTHKVKVFVSGPGGSHEAARSFLAMGAAFIKAGAMGVMVDNSGNCHGPRDWVDLASDEQMGGMYWAFVSVTATDDEIFSAGMHCLGFRDAEMPNPTDRQTSGMMMHEFLGYTYQSGATIVDGDPIGGPDGPDFFLRHVECTKFPKDSPWHNPYGVWRMEKAVDGEREHEE